jgi:hypothetical protein
LDIRNALSEHSLITVLPNPYDPLIRQASTSNSPKRSSSSIVVSRCGKWIVYRLVDAFVAAPTPKTATFYLACEGQLRPIICLACYGFSAEEFSGDCRSNSVRPLSVDISNAPGGSRTVAGVL